MRFYLKNIRSGKRRAEIVDTKSIVYAELSAEMENQKKILLAAFEKIVADWKSDVSFGAKKFLTAQYLAINIYPKGADKEIWFYVDLGTPKHDITVKSAPYLHFQAGTYVPKTMASPARTNASGGYVKDPQWVKVTTVEHPGSEGRDFTGTLAGDAKPIFDAQIEAAFKRAQRKINSQ